MTDIMDLLYGADDEPRTVTLPSGKVACIAEMTGLDQRAMNDRTKMNNGSAINEVLARCVVSIDGVKPSETGILGLLSGDRRTLMFFIRRYSLGKDYSFKAKCPNPDCGELNDWEVLLDELSFPIRPYKSVDSIITVESQAYPGLSWKFSLLDGVAEMKTVKLTRNSLSTVTDLELRNVQCSLHGGEWVVLNINKAKTGMLQELREIISEYEGDVDTKVSLTCPKCGYEYQFDLMSQVTFLIPGIPS
jgi:hypothetical protein